MTKERNIILNHDQITSKINRIAHQLLENFYEEKELIIIGIEPSGYIFAEKLFAILKEISSIKLSLGSLKINKDNPLDNTFYLQSEIVNFDDKVVIIADDVLNSGSTMMYGLSHFLKYHLKGLYTAVLVDRSHKRFPVKADFVGLSLATTLQQHIAVDFSNNKEYLAYLS
jgi:pyrimidine operon attenuation protein / uracil phosphoribosyltransferase